MKQTTKYSMFRHMEGNRELNEAKVKKFMLSIQQYGLRRLPILVNENMEVADGQHRLEACKRLNIPVWYEIEPGLDIEKCRAMNSISTNWKTQDYIDSYSKLGDINYKYLVQLQRQFRNEKVSTVVMAVTRDVWGGHKSKVIADGQFICTQQQYEDAAEVLDLWTSVSQYFRNVSGRTDLFAAAFFYSVSLPEVDVQKFLRNIERYQVEIVPVADLKQALELMETLYNRNNRSKVYIYTEYRKDKNR